MSQPRFEHVDITDPETLDQLIADCADIPAALRPHDQVLPVPRLAAAWTVDDACFAQVRELEEYV